MIPVTFKYTAKLDIATPMQQYLESKYSKEEAAKHADALSRFQSLRNDVASVVAPNEAARETLLTYFVQAARAADKFPVSETTVKIPFVWTDLFVAGRQISHYSWAYDRACALFNVAALESQLACSITRDSTTAIEQATKHFCQAAGVLDFIKRDAGSRILGTLPFDLTPQGLTMLTNLQLAQGQVCFYELASQKGMKNEVLARIAGQAADLYRNAYNAFTEAQWAEFDKAFPWSSYLKFNFITFDAASFWQMSQKALAEASAKGSGYGVELGWLNVAEQAALKALTTIRGSKDATVRSIDTGNMELLLRKIQTRKAEADNDNRKVYVEAITPAADLGHVPRAELAKLLPMPDLSAYESKGNLFAAIIPVEVAAAMAGVEDKLTAAVADAKEECNRASDEARAVLSALGLPGSLDAADPTNSAPGVPPTLWERIRKTQIEGGLPELARLQAANAAASDRATTTLREVTRTLDEESAADAACRRSYGDRWTAVPSDIIAGELRGEVAKYSKVAEVAAATDAAVTAKLEASRAKLTAISTGRSKAELDASIPSGYSPGMGAAAAAGGGAGGEAEVMRLALKESVGQLTALLDGRTRLCNEIKERFDRPAAVAVLLACDGSPAAVAAATDRIMATAGGPRAAVTANLAAQGPLLEVIKAQHARFTLVRAQDERTRARERALQDLSEACDRFDEIRSNLREGEAFYADLNRESDRLLIVARDSAAARGLQQRELMLSLRAQDDAALARSMAGMAVGGGGGPAGSAAAMPGAPTGGAPVQAYPRMGGGGGGGAAAPSAAGAYAHHPAAGGGYCAPGGAPGGGRAVPVSIDEPYMAPPAMPAAGGGVGASGPAPSVMAPPSYNPFDAWGGPSGAGGAPGGGHAIPMAMPLAGPPGGAGMGGHAAAAPAAPPMAAAAAAGTPGGGFFTAPRWFGGAPAAAPAAAAAASAPASPQLQQLLNMGFDRATAERALAANKNDVGAAIDSLLSGGGGSRV